MKPRLLWVTDEVPDPEFGGGSIRQYELLTRIADSAEIDLLLVGALRNGDLQQALRAVREIPPVGGTLQPALVRRFLDLRDVSLLRTPMEIRWARRTRESLSRELGDTNSYSLVQIEHEWFAPLLREDRRNPWAITLHNLISVRARQGAAIAPKRRVRWLLENDARNAVRLERWISRSYDTTIAVSEFDAARLEQAVVVPNGVDLDRFKPQPIPSQPRLLFSGSFNYEPNVDAASWFCREILPLVRQKVPDAKVALVGRQPDDRIRNLAGRSGVETHFDVPSLRPYLSAARVVVVPVRIGSGTRLKALEAMAAYRPLAGTSVGFEGLGLVQGVSAEIAADAKGLASGIVRLLTDDVYAERLAHAGRRLVEDHFSWDRIAEIYIEGVLGRFT